ncbi:MAG: lieA [Solirubrobacterales bacterium]|nr:lieA [Solirubrobacterales bacterium]
MLRPRVLLITFAIALGAAAPASAAATQFYVDDNGAAPPTPGCQDAGHPCTTIAAALTASRAVAGTGDTINLAAGTYNEDVVVDQAADNGLTIDGVRNGLSTSTISHVSGLTHAVQLGASSAPYNTGLTLKDLIVAVPAGSNTSKYAIDYYAVNSSLENVGVVVSDPANTVSALAASLPSGTTTFDGVVILSQGTGAGMTLFMTGGSVDVSNSGIAMTSTASTANGLLAFGAVHVTDTLVRLPAGSAATAMGAFGAGSHLTVDSSLLEGGTNGVLVQQGGTGTTTATIRRSTIDAATAGVDDGGIPGTSVNANTSSAADAVATIVVTDSLLVDKPTGHAVSGMGTPTVTCTNSIMPLVTNARVACDVAGGNAFFAPSALFQDSTTLDYRLTIGSPAVDAGTLIAGEPATDEAKKPRAVDGNLDCVARPDLGGLELQGQENTAPSATASGPATAAVGEAVAFTATGTDAEDASPTFAWAFSDGAAATGASAQHAFAAPGARSATVTVTDSHGCTGTAKVNVTVADPTTTPPPGAIDGPASDTLAPTFLSASLKGRTLRFKLSEAASVRVRVQRRACATVAGKRRCRMRAYRTVSVAAVKGANRTALKALPHGAYRLVLTATDAAKNHSKARRLGFSVR